MRKIAVGTLVLLAALASNVSAQVDTAWVRASGSGASYAVSFDGAANAYVCGAIENEHWRYDFLLRKYSPSGTLLWEQVHDGGIGDDFGSFVELDSLGGVIVGGEINDSTYSNPDIAVVKFDTLGLAQWAYVYACEGTGYDNLRDMAVTPAGDVFLLGRSIRHARSQLVTICLAPDGSERWVHVDSGHSASGQDLSLGANEFYVVGSTSSDEALARKYDLSGNLIWERIFNNGAESEQAGSESAIDESGNLYLVGRVVIGPPALPHPADIFAASFTDEGDLRWGGIVRSTPGIDEHMNSLVSLPDDGMALLITESGWPNLIANQGSRITKLSQAGEVIWDVDVPGRLASKLTSDQQGKLYLPHVSFGSSYPSNCNDIRLLCVDAGGSDIWSLCVGQPAIAWGRSFAYGVSVDVDGSVYIAAEMSNRPAAVRITQNIELRGMDILPTSCPNIINTGAADLDYPGIRPGAAAANRPTVPVAILGTKAFDVSRVDPSTIEIAGLSPLSHRLLDVSRPVDPRESECECTAAGADGYTDLVLYFDQAQFVAALGPVNDGEVRTLELTGKTKTGVPLSGSDCVTIKEGPTRISTLASAGEKIETGFAAYPNPFNAATVVSFSLATESDLRLEVYDVLGRRVATLVDDMMPAGEHQVNWDAAGVASGVYFARLSTSAGMMTRKMVLVR